MDACEAIMESDTEKVYVDNCLLLRIACKNFPKFLEYVKTTIFGPVKEKVVRYWSDSVMHIENTLTNITKYVDKWLKKFMGNNSWVTCKNWAFINNMIKL